jgi:fumarylacetoacetate (FAA) hydrolase
MKLASLKSGRDGRLLVVTKDLTRASDAAEVAPTLQAALDEWEMLAPQLREISDKLNRGVIDGFPFDPSRCGAPLPRAFHWADGAAYLNHLELARMARGAELPKSFWTEPVMQQGGSDAFIGPRDPIEVLRDEGWGVDFEAEVAVIVDDTHVGVTPDVAREQIKLIALVNDVTLRGLVPGEMAKGFGHYQAKPAAAFCPCVVTPDELGIAWDGGRIHLPLYSKLNGLVFGKPNAGVDMAFDFPTLIAHAALTRNLCAGAIVGSGPVSNKGQAGRAAEPVADGGVGYSCIAELRMVETIETGKPITPFLSFGDRIEIEMLDAAGRSIFGRIDQRVAPYEPV